MRKVPKLRFKEFNDEWEEKKLGEISDNNIKWSFTGGPFGSDLKSEDYTSTGIRIIQLQNIGDGQFINESKIYTSLKKADELLSCNIFPNEILISKMGNPVTRALIVPSIEKRYLMCSDGIRMVVNQEKYNSVFIMETINNKDFRTKAENISTGSTRKRIGLAELKKLSVTLPSLQEQEKIANFLSSVDKKISLTEEKLELFREYKKGVMQKIFSQELRFKDSEENDYPKWEEKRLGGILIKNKKKNKNNEYTLVQSISNKYGFVNQDEYFEDRKIASNNLSNYYIIENKNFAYNPSRINVGSLAYKKDFLISVISPLYVSFYADNIYVNDIFLLNWFFSLPFYRQMNSSFEGSVRNNLSYDTLSNFNILLPSLKEQQKIADFLSSIDTKIENIEKELEGLKEFKKGLLQQMFV